MTKSFAFYSAAYVTYAVLGIVILIAVGYAIEVYAPQHLSGLRGVTLLPLILPAMLVAQSFYRNEQRRMGGGEGWLWSIWFTVLAIVVSVASIWVGTLLQPLSGQELAELKAIMTDDSNVLLIVVAIFAAILMVLNRLMIWSGIRGAIKQQEKQAAKNASNG